MTPKTPESDEWSTADIAAMLTGRDERQAAEPSYQVQPVELSSGFHPEEDSYVIDPDYLEILGIDDPADLIRRKDSISR
jgi:hypothetical protein